jgi:hypothetical protein
MRPFWIVLAGALAAAPVNAASPATDSVPAARQKSTPAQLRVAVHDALRSEATSRGASREAAIRKLLALDGDLEKETRLSDDQRRELRALVRTRLARSGQALKVQLNKDSKPGSGSAQGTVADVLKSLQRDDAVLAQRPQPPGQSAAILNPPGQFGTNGQELIDLIQNTIAPASWEINGGPGVIRYFSNNQSLVIRQTDEVHGLIEDVIRQVRDP